MNKELVVIDDGQEVDWYDPIDRSEVVETDEAWHFNNGYHEYTVKKKPGRRIVIRDLVRPKGESE